MASTLGQLLLTLVFIVIFYDAFFVVMSATVKNLDYAVGYIENNTNSTNSSTPFENTRKLAHTLLSWEVFVATNLTAFAVLLFISFTREALESGWS